MCRLRPSPVKYQIVVELAKRHCQLPEIPRPIEKGIPLHRPSPLFFDPLVLRSDWRIRISSQNRPFRLNSSPYLHHIRHRKLRAFAKTHIIPESLAAIRLRILFIVPMDLFIDVTNHVAQRTPLDVVRKYMAHGKRCLKGAAEGGVAGNDARRVQQDLDTVQHLYGVAERHQDAEVLIAVAGCLAASLKCPDGLIDDTPEDWPTQLSDFVSLD